MRKLTAVVSVVAVGLLVLGACGSSSSGKKSSGSSSKTGSEPVSLPGSVTNKGTRDVSSATSVAVEADDYYFEPTFIKAKPGETLTVQLKNEGKQPHTFTITGMADQMLNPDQQATVQVTVPQSGALNFYCRFHRSMGMQGAIFTSAGQAVATGASSGAGGGATTTTSPVGGSGY